MKKNSIYMLSVAFFFACVIFIIYRYVHEKKRNAIVPPTLKERKGTAGIGNEWEKTKKMAAYYTDAARKNPDNQKAFLALASLFIQESRVTGDYLYYDAAAMSCVEHVLSADPRDFDALTMKALLYMSQHHFSDGLAVAEHAQKINPYNAFVYGILVDGNVEMGNYAKAVEYADKMVSIRPDLRSYSRISYLREIHGDNEGAIEAMKLAVEAGAPGDEPTEWARVHLGQLYENVNDLQSAEMCYRVSLEERPGYPYALAGMAHIAKTQKNYNKAIQLLEQAESLMSNVYFKEELINVYRENGSDTKADALAKGMITEMKDASRKAASDPNAGHYTDKEFALAYLQVKDYDSALKHALMEYNRRPLNIDVNETVGWVYYNMGEYQKALPYMHAAIKTNSKNPVLISRAELLFRQTGTASAPGYTKQ
jgi:tetratricopeptide (TPR) repeat protein